MQEVALNTVSIIVLETDKAYIGFNNGREAITSGVIELDHVNGTLKFMPSK